MSADHDRGGDFQADASNNPPRALPTAALRALEPRVGGFWAITGQEQSTGTISMTYFMSDGSEAVTYNMRACKSEEDVRQQFANRIYHATPSTLTAKDTKSKPAEANDIIPIPNWHELANNQVLCDQQAYFSTLASTAFQSNHSFGNYDYMPPLLAARQSLPLQYTGPAPPVTQVSMPQTVATGEDTFRSTFPQPQLSGEKLQFMNSSSEDQSGLDKHTPVDMNWGYAEGFLSASTEPYMSQEDSLGMNRSFDDTSQLYEDPFNPTMTDDLCAQFVMKDHFDDVSTNP